MIVADTNLIGYLYLTSDRSWRAEQAFRKDPVWAAPLLWRSEFRNVLALYFRRGLLSLEDAHQIMDQALRLMRGMEYQVTPLRVLSLVVSSSCSAYDCEFFALAQDLSVPLVTADRHVLDQFPETSISLDAFISA